MLSDCLYYISETAEAIKSTLWNITQDFDTCVKVMVLKYICLQSRHEQLQYQILRDFKVVFNKCQSYNKSLLKIWWHTDGAIPNKLIIYTFVSIFLNSLLAELRIGISDITILFVSTDLASNESRILAGKTSKSFSKHRFFLSKMTLVLGNLNISKPFSYNFLKVFLQDRFNNMWICSITICFCMYLEPILLIILYSTRLVLHNPLKMEWKLHHG